MAVEHIVQGHGLDWNAVEVGPASTENTAGTEAAWADVEDGHLKSEAKGELALAGKVRVSVEVDDAIAEKLVSSFEIFHGDIHGRSGTL